MARLDLTADVPGDEPTPPPRPQTVASPPPPPVDERPRKFTMLVDAADDERARRLTDAVVGLAGIRAIKSMRADVIRALVALAVEDERLQQRVAKRLRSTAGLPSRR
jgi:hypothetical protein